MIQRLQEKRNEEGFTLIELLIVIIVLGILAAIVVFAVGNTKSDALESSCKTAVNAVQLSAEAVKVKEGSYPAAGDDAHLAEPAGKGGMLKAWPAEDSTDYDLDWDGSAVDVKYDGDNDGALDETGTCANLS
jgi:prepilin-type N-terminal cleavage/methylation domain-containing protein